MKIYCSVLSQLTKCIVNMFSHPDLCCNVSVNVSNVNPINLQHIQKYKCQLFVRCFFLLLFFCWYFSFFTSAENLHNHEINSYHGIGKRTQKKQLLIFFITYEGKGIEKKPPQKYRKMIVNEVTCVWNVRRIIMHSSFYFDRSMSWLRIHFAWKMVLGTHTHIHIHEAKYHMNTIVRTSEQEWDEVTQFISKSEKDTRMRHSMRKKWTTNEIFFWLVPLYVQINAFALLCLLLAFCYSFSLSILYCIRCLFIRHSSMVPVEKTTTTTEQRTEQKTKTDAKTRTLIHSLTHSHHSNLLYNVLLP